MSFPWATRLLAVLTAALPLNAGALASENSTYPDRTITIICASGAGGEISSSLVICRFVFQPNIDVVTLPKIVRYRTGYLRRLAPVID